MSIASSRPPSSSSPPDLATPRRRVRPRVLLLVLTLAAASFLSYLYWRTHLAEPLRSELDRSWQQYGLAAAQRAAPIELFSRAFGDFDQTFTATQDRFNDPPLARDRRSQPTQDLDQLKAAQASLQAQFSLLDDCRSWLLRYRQQLTNQRDGSGAASYLAFANKHIQACLLDHNAALSSNDLSHP